MRFFIIGVNHQDCPVEVRERLHFSQSRQEAALCEFVEKNIVSEAVILSTCNRVEIYGAAEQPSEAIDKIHEYFIREREIAKEELDTYLYRYEDKEAIRHLCRVAAGLDSLVIGENEILGQLRDAFRVANRMRSVHSLLYRLLEKALKTGKDVRSQTKINEGAVSIPSVAVELGEKIFGQLSGEKVMVLGTGEMSALTLKNLRTAGADVRYVVSRNQERGEKVAIEFGAEWVPLEAWEKHISDVDILIASTAAPHVLVHRDKIQEAMKERRYKPLFLIDIAVPRNIEGRVNELDDVYLYNVDDLKGVSAANLKLRSREIKAAEDLIDQGVLSFQSWLEQLDARPMIERYEDFINQVLEKDLSRLMQETGFSEDKKNEARERLRAKLLHPPLNKIKEASRNGGVARYVEALQSLFNLDQSK